MKFAFLFLVLFAYPFTMVDPPKCQAGGCASNPDGTCSSTILLSCGTFRNPSRCTTVPASRPGKFRCICVSAGTTSKLR
jgi:hypothetical protein